ncbi:tetratricopeptide repeat protein [Flavobacterium sp.]|uniref:tetratricopeptide repeat protein n=1 Tax=Flavobacterium sp. TaxID=239 RepID=UPI00261E3551|nr:tetratricopeptide repeat protein [Flavobacterium sp.]MDD2984987.1 tetratricopeptide repeat protein [Flavobacterium sp.]
MKQRLTLIVLFFTFFLQAQTEKKETDKVLPKANKEFDAKNYAAAEAQYRISNSKGISGATPAYNLGNAIYKQNHPSEAKFAYAKALEKAKTKEEKHKAFHNLGNVFMQEKQYSKAVESYKNALRNNPADEETRYNYALAKEYLKNNPEDPEKDKKDDQQDEKNKDKNKGDEEQKEDKEKGKDEEKKQQPKEGDKQKDENGQPKSQPSGISKESVQNLLDAVNNEEKKVQEKVNAQKIKAKPTPTEKDW